MSEPNYPRLLYVGDVDVELISAGSTLLYRLLECYPSDKLCILQTSNKHSDRSLSKVTYFRQHNRLADRLRRTRFFRIGSLIEYIEASKPSFSLPKAISEFNPEAVVTVTYRFKWIFAHKIARELNIPLHLILHDDIIAFENHGSFLNSLIDRTFKPIYQKASSRLCISPNMENYYRKKYKVVGEILYPMQGRFDKIYDVSEKSIETKEKLHFCYAGSIHSSDFLPMLNRLAGIITSKGHFLSIFSEARNNELKNFQNLCNANVFIKKFIHPDELKSFMREQVDVNILLNSFEWEEAFRLNFASKMVDYSAIALPVLMWGPETSGTISWAKSLGYACISNEKNGNNLLFLIDQLQDSRYRIQTSEFMCKVREEYFGYHRNYNIFLEAIQKT